jgi:hypothetical protein
MSCKAGTCRSSLGLASLVLAAALLCCVLSIEQGDEIGPQQAEYKQSGQQVDSKRGAEWGCPHGCIQTASSLLAGLLLLSPKGAAGSTHVLARYKPCRRALQLQ